MSWVDRMPAGERAMLRDAGRIGASRFEGPLAPALPFGYSEPIDEEPCLLCAAPINVNGDGHEDWCMGLDS